MANRSHLIRKWGNLLWPLRACSGRGFCFVFAGAATGSGPSAPGRLTRGSRALEITFFYCYCFTAQSPPPPLPLLVFSPPTAPFSSPPPPPPAQLKERGRGAAASFIWGNSWPLQVYYARRSQCQARRTRRAKHRGCRAEQYPPRAERRERGRGGGSHRPSVQRRTRLACTRRPSAPAAVRWSCGHAEPGCRARSSPVSFSHPSAWPAHGRGARTPWPHRCTDFILRAPLGAVGPGVHKAGERE